MKHELWRGRLPSYWVESPWWGPLEDGVLLLIPNGSGRSCQLRDLDGRSVWTRDTVANVLLVIEDGVAVTARARDGRSDAVYFQFEGLDVNTGELVWTLPPSIQLHLPKGGIPFVPTAAASPTALRLDMWRSLRTGEPIADPGLTVAAVPRGEWHSGTTVITDMPHGLKVCNDTSVWTAQQISLRDVHGIKGSCLFGLSQGSMLWCRDLASGNLRWSVDLDDQGIVTPSERLVGFDATPWVFAETVPVLGVLTEDEVAVIQEGAVGSRLVRWPSHRELDTWAPGAVVALLGALEHGLLVVEEYEDRMGCLWFVN